MVAPLLGALAGALFGTFGSWYVLVRLSPRQQRLAELRDDFYEYLRLATEYWNADVRSIANEARILALDETMGIKFHDLAGTGGAVWRAYQTTSHDRRALRRIVTGGRFQQAAWAADGGRAREAGTIIARIVGRLPS